MSEQPGVDSAGNNNLITISHVIPKQWLIVSNCCFVSPFTAELEKMIQQAQKLHDEYEEKETEMMRQLNLTPFAYEEHLKALAAEAPVSVAGM